MRPTLESRLIAARDELRQIGHGEHARTLGDVLAMLGMAYQKAAHLDHELNRLTVLSDSIACDLNLKKGEEE